MFWIRNKKVYGVIKVILKSFLVILALIVIKIIITAYPNMFFWHSITYKNFSVHSTQVIDNRIYKILDKATSNLTTFKINDTNAVYRVYLCQSSSFYHTLIFPYVAKSIAFNFPHTNMIFIKNADVLKDIANIEDMDDTRKLSKVITHEITHTFEEKVFQNAKIPFSNVETWKTEGYCDLVGYNDTLDITNAKEFIKGHKNTIMTFKDIRREYYFAVSYLVYFEKMSFEDILKSNLTLTEVLDKIENIR